MIATVVLDIAALVISVGLFIMMVTLIIRRQFHSFDVRMGTMSATLTGIDEKVELVNTAVNHVEPGTPTLVSRVGTAEHRLCEIEHHQSWERGALRAVARHVGVELPEYIKEQKEAS
jgi:uncharacterized protein YoxC